MSHASLNLKFATLGTAHFLCIARLAAREFRVARWQTGPCQAHVAHGQRRRRTRTWATTRGYCGGFQQAEWDLTCLTNNIGDLTNTY